ncbi:MAG: hypothetical protein V4687_06420 [Bacteroidota bacterium]
MNFLSHFYFERNNKDANTIIGVVLPDFVKNAEKTINLYPSKEPQLFEENEVLQNILKGWERHIKVDALFHSSEFFNNETQKLKQLILPAIEGSPVKPFFLAHIGLELILDHLLVINGAISINGFYDALTEADKAALDTFLKKCRLQDTSQFFNFLNGFISGRYLFSYQRIENIAYALNRICMRIWDQPFTESQIVLLTTQLAIYKTQLEPNYLIIFEEIGAQL